MALSAVERKKRQRQRDRLLGWTEVTVRVAREHAEELRAFAASLPPPSPPTDPRQLDLIEALDRQITDDDQADQPGLDL